MTDRDHFAAAALTGLIANGDYSVESTPVLAWRMADAMLRERDATTEKDSDVRDSRNWNTTDHDAAPAARARTDADRGRADKADSRPGEGTGDTPVTNPLPKETRAEVSVRIDGVDHPVPYCRIDEKRVNWPTIREGTPAEGSVPREGTEPVAWAVVSDSTEQIDCEFIYPDEATAGDVALDSNGGVVPLYSHAQPTLTDAERSAIKEASELYIGTRTGVALGGLLERMK